MISTTTEAITGEWGDNLTDDKGACLSNAAPDLTLHMADVRKEQPPIPEWPSADWIYVLH